MNAGNGFFDGVATLFPEVDGGVCSLHGSSGAEGDSTPTCGLTDTKRVWAAFRNPEGCQMVAGGRSGAATPGRGQ
jgi:hypothetical protein